MGQTVTTNQATIIVAGDWGDQGTASVGQNGGPGEAGSDASYVTHPTYAPGQASTLTVEGGVGGHGGTAVSQGTNGGDGGDGGDADAEFEFSHAGDLIVSVTALGGLGGNGAPGYNGLSGVAGNGGNALAAIDNSTLTNFKNLHISLWATAGLGGQSGMGPSAPGGDGGSSEIDFEDNTLSFASTGGTVQIDFHQNSGGSLGPVPWVIGTTKTVFSGNTFTGGGGDDTLHISDFAYKATPSGAALDPNVAVVSSSNVFDGGAGYDTFWIDDSKSHFSIQYSGGSYVVTDIGNNPGLTIKLSEVEELDFSDSTVYLLPPLLDLALLSADVYNDGVSTSLIGSGTPDGFHYFADNHRFDYHSTASGYSFTPSIDPGLIVAAYISADSSQVVIAVRGTDFSISDSGLQTQEADQSWASAVGLTPTLVSFVKQTADFVRAIQLAVPNATIILTGHSLGGAIAQLIGEASGLPADVFNAPGGGAFYNQLLSDGAFASIDPQNTLSPVNANFRIWGDQISLVGSRIGSQFTLPSPKLSATDTSTTNIALAAYVNHKIDTVVGQLAANIQPQPGVLGPSAPVTSAILAKAFNLYVESWKTIISAKNIFNVFDPPSGLHFVIDKDAASPKFAAIELPPLTNVANYLVSFEANGAWSSPVAVAPLVTKSFASAADGVRFQGVDQSGNIVKLPDGFALALSFASTGTFTGSILQTAAADLSDFSADGNSDFLFQNANGQAAVWLLNGATRLSAASVGTNPGTSWVEKGAGDFNGDGKADILWQNTSGQAAIWFMSGTVRTSAGNAGSNPGTSWHVIGAGDFNGDGMADILWQNTNSQVSIWLMNGTARTSAATIGTVPGTAWHAKAGADFDGNGTADILFQNTNGQAAIWLMNGLSRTSAATVGASPGSAWHVKGAGDFNGDGKPDILWQNDNGQASIWLMNGTTRIGSANISTSPGTAWHVMGAEDINGDGKSDIVWQNDSGQASVWFMNGTTKLSAANIGSNPGASWHLVTG